MTTRSLHTRTYSPTSITAALASPSSFSGNQHVLIGPAAYHLDEKQELYKLPESWDPLLILHALEDIPKIRSISVDMDHMIFHSATSDEILRYNSDNALEQVFEALDSECHCIALCKWSLPSLPKTTIQHFPVRKLIHESFGYRLDKAKWKSFVAEHGQCRPELMAFDYTAEFHSRDIFDGDSDKESFVNMGFYGQGCYDCGSLRDLSMRFAQDMMWNRELFAREPQRWRPDLYQWARKHRGVVFSIPNYEYGDE